MISIGIERLIAEPPLMLQGKKLGLLCNQASTDAKFRHSRDLIQAAFPGQLSLLFSPQHGFFSEKQDNMIESDHSKDPVTGLPVFSLYGEHRKPTPAMFTDIDVLLVDLIDVGTRVYTFIWTIVYCMRTAAETGKTVVVIDRPNPIGGKLVEGNMLLPAWSSFVGLHPIPMRHGLTIGELAMLCNIEMGIGADLHVISMEGWRRDMLFAQTGRPWLFPSPNMPSPITALVYPGQVIWEGTNASEGRGTTLPFELIGAPYIKHREVLSYTEKSNLPGCTFRPLVFEPTSGKWAGNACFGFQIHVTDAENFRPYRTSLVLLQALYQLYPEFFAYKEPPYEYEYEKLPMDMILGDQQVRLALEQGVPVAELEKEWLPGLAEYEEKRRGVFLYH